MLHPDFAALTYAELLDQLGADVPSPGGGSGVALAGAMGASLVAKLARATVGRKRYAAHERLMVAVAEEADSTRDLLLELAAQDAAAFAAAAEAPREAIEVPLQIMEACVTVIGLAKNAIERGNRNAVPDAYAGTELCRAGFKGAAAIVRANLDAFDLDEEYRNQAQTRMDEMLYMGTKVATALESYVADLRRP